MITKKVITLEELKINRKLKKEGRKEELNCVKMNWETLPLTTTFRPAEQQKTLQQRLNYLQ